MKISDLFTNKTKKKQNTDICLTLQQKNKDLVAAITTLMHHNLAPIPQELKSTFANIDHSIATVEKTYTRAQKHNPTTLHSLKSLQKDHNNLVNHHTLINKKHQLLQTYTLKNELKNLNEEYLRNLNALKKRLGDPLPQPVHNSLTPFEAARRTLPGLMSIPLLTDLARHINTLNNFKSTLENGIGYLHNALTQAPLPLAPATKKQLASAALPQNSLRRKIQYGFRYLFFILSACVHYIINCARNCFITKKAPPPSALTIQKPTLVTLSEQQKQFTPYLNNRLQNWVQEARSQVTKKKQPLKPEQVSQPT